MGNTYCAERFQCMNAKCVGKGNMFEFFRNPEENKSRLT